MRTILTALMLMVLVTGCEAQSPPPSRTLAPIGDRQPAALAAQLPPPKPVDPAMPQRLSGPFAKAGDLPSSAPKLDPSVRPVSGTDSTKTPVALGEVKSTLVRPMVELRVSAPDRLNAEQPSAIEIWVSNRGQDPLEDVVVADNLDSAIELISSSPQAQTTDGTLTWSLGRLDADQSKSISLMVRSKKGAKPGPAMSRAIVRYSASAQSTMEVAGPEVGLTVVGSHDAAVGDTLELVVQATNKGRSPVSGIKLKSLLPASLAHPQGPELEYEIGELAPGELRTIPLRLGVTQPGTADVKIHLIAGNEIAAISEHGIAIADVQVSVDWEGPSVRFLKQTGSYKVRVTNRGSAPVATPRVYAKIPAGLTFTAASDNGRWDSGISQASWSLPMLAPNETRELSLTCVAAKVGKHAGEVGVTVGKKSLSASPISATVQEIASFDMEVVDKSDPIEVTGETVYQIHLSNRGAAPVTGVVLVCDIPPELDAIAADGPVSQKIAGSVLTFEPIPEIPPQEQVTFRVKCKGLKEGSARFRATVKADQSVATVSEEESTIIFGSP